MMEGGSVWTRHYVRRVHRTRPTLQPVPLTVFTSHRFADHVNPPGHPDHFAQAEVIQVVACALRKQGVRVLEPRPATDGEMARVHDRDYLTLVRETAGRARALDPDTYTSPDTSEIARLAAGAGI